MQGKRDGDLLMSETLSSRLTYIWWSFPLVVFPALAISALIGWVRFFQSPWNGRIFLQIMGFTGFAALVGLVSFRVCLPLKVVTLTGVSLRIRTMVTSADVPVSEIAFIDGPDATSFKRITVEFNSPSPFGGSITFAAPFFQATNIAGWLRRLSEKAKGS